MGKITILSPEVVEQIAAGEVIERPASVVKELIENSIDSGATRISIIIEEGGMSRISITDNGSGIPREELPLAVHRHATSKITAETDLYKISSLGFRGEALSSIAAVSRFEITSSNVGDGLGWKLHGDGGHIPKEPEPAQHLKGTTVECRDIFFNLPARKKFLKTVRGETMSIVKTLEQVFLAFPNIHFIATVNGKKRYDTPAVDTPLMRIAQIAGTEIAEDLIHCTGETDGYSVEIYISPPHKVQARPRYQSLFVNLRRVDNTTAAQGILRSFSEFISGHLKPNWFCYMDIDPGKIDVNAHPTKAEIKFDAPREIFSFLYGVVQKQVRKKQEENFPSGQSRSDGLHNQDSSLSFSLKEEYDVPLHHFPKSSHREQEETSYIRRSNSETPENQITMPLISKTSGATGEKGTTTINHGAPDSLPCFQIHKRYIISPVKEGVLVIDQHAAHERILYEKILHELTEGGTDSQQLLFPVTLTLTSEEKELLMEIRELFEKTGFNIQDFGGKSVAVSAVPATGYVKSTDISDTIQEMLAAYREEDDKAIIPSLHKRFAASYACGAAIKFGRELGQEEMNSLMNSLFRSQNPHICPHGRPTISKISLDELKRRFLR
ncbi:MAG: DNA mismatch repair endonuclease MutL [Fibrobacterota bacterium]